MYLSGERIDVLVLGGRFISMHAMPPGIVERTVSEIKQKAFASAKSAVQKEEGVKSQGSKGPFLGESFPSRHVGRSNMPSMMSRQELHQKALDLVPELTQKIQDRAISTALVEAELFTACFPGTAETCGLPWGSRAPQYHLMDQNGCDENDPNVFLGVEVG